MESVETDGDSVEAAVAAALERLGLERKDAHIEVLDEGARGFLGIGARPARVRVRRTAPDSAAPPDTAAGAAVAATPPALAASGELAAKAGDVLRQILDRLDVQTQVAAHDDGDHITLDITAADGAEISGWLIGRKGQTLDALEYLVARIVSRDSQQPVHLIVDAEGYRARRAAALGELAGRVATQAKRSRRAIPLEPMSPRERRIVHLALQDDPDVRTHSTGEGAQRRLVIAPVGRRR